LLVEILSGLKEAIRRFVSSTTPYEKSVESFIRELQRELIRGDVNVKLVFELSSRIRERALNERPPPGASRRDWFVKIVYEELVRLFGGDQQPEAIPKKKPYIIMLVGVQGSGKTTSAGKLAWYYKSRRFRVGLIQTDTYRPGAYDQLKQIAESLQVEFYGDKNAVDPVEIALAGLEFMRERGVHIIIIDTAGRHGYGSEEALMEEMRRLSEAIRPDEVMFVLDASIGQKAKDLAERFHRATPIGTIFVTKLDGTAKGGGALSAVAVTGARVKFVGMGEKLEEIEVFKPSRFVGRLLGVGDIEGLVERLSMLEEGALEKHVEDMLRGRVDMRLIYHQIREIRKMGPLSRILRMIPGFGTSLPLTDESTKIGEEKMDRWLAIIQSMTYEELDKPEIILREKSRLRRIAIGSGTSPEDVRELLTYYQQLKKIVKQVKRRKELLKKLKLDQQWLGEFS